MLANLSPNGRRKSGNEKLSTSTATKALFTPQDIKQNLKESNSNLDLTNEEREDLIKAYKQLKNKETGELEDLLNAKDNFHFDKILDRLPQVSFFFKLKKTKNRVVNQFF